MRILIVEDQKETAETIRDELRDSFTTDIASNISEASYLSEMNDYDLIILDIVLSDGSGIDFCRKMRERGLVCPIIIVSAKASIDEKIQGLDAGADDYLIKPFSFDELMARIRALLRRRISGRKIHTISVGDLTLDLQSRIVSRERMSVQLRKKEFDVLEYLARNNGKVMTREMILENVWEADKNSMNNTIDVHIKMIRDKLDRGFKKKIILTIHGVGYKLDA